MNRARELADYLGEAREDGLAVVPMLPGDMELAAKALRSYEAVRRIDLTLYVNAADISAADSPYQVVMKLQAAIDEAMRQSATSGE